MDTDEFERLMTEIVNGIETLGEVLAQLRSANEISLQDIEIGFEGLLNVINDVK